MIIVTHLAIFYLEHNGLLLLHSPLICIQNLFSFGCFSAIRKWDQAIRERNDFKDQYVKFKRQHEDAVKEINQNMNVRIKASKDIKRLTDERNAAMQVRRSFAICKTECSRSQGC